jgi:nitrous oxide reductase accessory protein NosL
MEMSIRSKTFLALVVLTPLLSACNQTKRQAEANIRDLLVDPDSTKFYDYYFNDKTNKGCYVINSKNRMGGYTGKSVAHFTKTKDGIQSGIYSDFITMNDCKETADKVEKPEK